MRKKYTLTIITLIIGLIIAFFASFYVGRYSGVTVGEVIKILLNSVYSFFEKTWTEVDESIVLNLRFPRIVAAMIVGASLSVAGAAYQALFSNPMASPDTLGVSSGAGLGAACAILFGMGSIAVEITAFSVGCMAVMITFIISNLISRGKKTTIFLVLIGMVISSLLSAVLSGVKYIADPDDKLPAITYWLMGSFSSVGFEDLKIVIWLFLLGMIPLFLIKWRMNLLCLSSEELTSLGENLTLLRLITIASATLLTASSISISGGIGWVGLIVPHIARLIIGSDFKRILPVSALIGAIYLLLIDNISRGLLAFEIPIGILTAVVGAPLFFAILTINRRSILDGD